MDASAFVRRQRSFGSVTDLFPSPLRHGGLDPQSGRRRPVYWWHQVDGAR